MVAELVDLTTALADELGRLRRLLAEAEICAKKLPRHPGTQELPSLIQSAIEQLEIALATQKEPRES